MNRKKQLGTHGETIAVNYLTRKNYRIIDRNFHAPGGEIDIVARDPDGIWTLVEVKFRATDAFGDGASAITRSKMQKMCVAAERFFCEKCGFSEVPEFQIDAVILHRDGEKVLCRHFQNLGLDDPEF